MKKLYFIAAAVTVMCSCTSDSFVNEGGNEYPVNGELRAITFNSSNAATTRADKSGADAAALLGNNFVVEGVKGDGTNQTVVFDNYNVNWVTNTANTTTSNTNDWEYVGQTVNGNATVTAQSIKYWDYAEDQYDFIAYSAGTSTGLTISKIDASKMNGVVTSGKVTDGAYTVEGAADELAKFYIADMVTAYRDPIASTDYNKVVQFKFRSLSAKVRVALYETIPGYSVKEVKFYTDEATKDDSGKAHLFTTGTNVFNKEGKYIVYYPTTGSAKKSDADYNKAHVAFEAAASGTEKAKEFGTLDLTNKGADKEVNEAAGKVYLGRTSNTATFAGTSTDNYYTPVIPNETATALNLKVDYTLLSTDGTGETIHVTGATAQVPAAYGAWKSGYAYTYIFKISQNTNGLTNPSAGPAGLYPITFDAVVMDSETDGVQETITTVSTPSITTYAKGAVVTANDEYKKGNNIYVVLDNAAALTVGTNANLYTVELEAGAAQTINEASVANAIATAIANGGAASPYVVTDANGKKMTVKAAAGLTAVTEVAAADAPDGKAITVNGAKFTPSAAGVYAFEYIDGTNKYYKIIKVVE